jgi:glyoxylase-like metal-dependent hydrolase (beta-lactamase superfamily II)
MGSDKFTEVADGVYVLRYPVLDVNVTLITADGRALLVDTLSTDRQARALAEAARRVTTDPWTIVNTHHHFDHCFGNATLAVDGRDIWAYEETVALLSQQAATLPQQVSEEYAAQDPDFAAELAQVRVLAPQRVVHRETTVTVSGRPVVLRHLGRGHTAGDLVVQVPDADVVIAGDLIEQGAPPSFDDSYPLEWPQTVARLQTLLGPDTVVVPGHGAVVDRKFVEQQQAELTDLAQLIRDGHRAGAPIETVADRAPFGRQAALSAARRGYRQLATS